ncbi:hypothetical protein [Gemmatimonas sp.]|uniref:hypothetical protein n=1 Tax=Gemmatimonas sp. TaxID=1962908 RepID=UPI0022C3CE39|nr:hypothetical protein [Gemmatimonas sp.]MCZ8205587.1 hypothetical protein [Gemmatimonas sp.]
MRRSCALLTISLAFVGCSVRMPWAPPLVTSPSGPALPRIPRDAARFEIDSVTDSTATFRVREARWVRKGLQSYVVDPQQRDALVARLRVIHRDSATATALVTGQVTRVKPEHFLLVVRPKEGWWHERRFWMGTLVGAIIGAGSVAAAR